MNEHRQNSSQKNYLSKNFIRKPIILSLKAIRVTLTESWILSRKKKRPKTSNVNAKIGLKSYKTSMKQLEILKFPFKNEIFLTINVQIVSENSLKTLPPCIGFFSEQENRCTVKKPTRLKSLFPSLSYNCTFSLALRGDTTHRSTHFLFLANKNYHLIN